MSEASTKHFIWVIGLIGGWLAGIAFYISYFFNFVPFGPAILWQFWPHSDRPLLLTGPWGHLTAIVCLGIFSILAALLYFFVLSRMKTPWAGLWYGAVLWAVIFLGVNQLIPGIKSVADLGWQTNIVFVSLFLLYGLFVGYSISYEVEMRAMDQRSG